MNTSLPFRRSRDILHSSCSCSKGKQFLPAASPPLTPVSQAAFPKLKILFQDASYVAIGEPLAACASRARAADQWLLPGHLLSGTTINCWFMLSDTTERDTPRHMQTNLVECMCTHQKTRDLFLLMRTQWCAWLGIGIKMKEFLSLAGMCRQHRRCSGALRLLNIPTTHGPARMNTPAEACCSLSKTHSTCSSDAPEEATGWEILHISLASNW